MFLLRLLMLSLFAVCGVVFLKTGYTATAVYLGTMFVTDLVNLNYSYKKI